MAVLVGGGLGIPRGFYRPLARWLAGRGFAVLLLDYRGIAGSGAGLNPRHIRMSDWGEHDLEAGLLALRERFPGRPLGFIGHSGGGQLVGLAPSCTELSALVFVATQHGHWRNWPWYMQLPIWKLWHLLLPGLSVGRAMFPARAFGLSVVDVPTGVTRQWAQWGRAQDYLFDPSCGLDVSRFPKLGAHLLSLEPAGDRYAPPRATGRLLAHYTACAVERQALPPGLGHFGFFRERASGHWPRLEAGLIRGA